MAPGLVLGLAAGLVGTLLSKRQGLTAEYGLLWGYLLLAVAGSFIVSLKEPRHWIGLLPVGSLLAGTGVARWLAVAERNGRRWWRYGLCGALVVFLLILASPLRGVPWGEGGLLSLKSGVYRQRLAENDRFYGVLQRAGEQLAQRVPPGQVVTVAHQGTVVGYYADRPYMFLYTLPEEGVLQVLDEIEQGGYLVWDDPYFLALDQAQARRVQDRVEECFEVDQLVSEGPRQVTIYRRVCSGNR